MPPLRERFFSSRRQNDFDALVLQVSQSLVEVRAQYQFMEGSDGDVSFLCSLAVLKHGSTLTCHNLPLCCTEMSLKFLFFSQAKLTDCTVSIDFPSESTYILYHKSNFQSSIEGILLHLALFHLTTEDTSAVHFNLVSTHLSFTKVVTSFPPFPLRGEVMGLCIYNHSCDSL